MFQDSRSLVTISLPALIRNYRAIRRSANSMKIQEFVAVVKGDAYGHGAIAVAHALRREGVTWFAVSSVDEALQLRHSGLPGRILLISGLDRKAIHEIIHYHLTPVLHSTSDIHWLSGQTRKLEAKIPFHLEMDSGLSRLGTSESLKRISAELAKLPHPMMEGLMTHFASATDPSGQQNQLQISRWKNFLPGMTQSGFRPRYRHAHASAALARQLQLPDTNMVRVGTALYGLLDLPTSILPAAQLTVEPVLQWQARLLLVKPVAAGESVGYGATYRVPAATTLGIVAAGYADGIPPALANRGYLLAAGQRFPLRGAISMDLSIIDLGQNSQIKPGSWVTLIGEQGQERIAAAEIAQLAGIPIPALTVSMNARSRRIYR